MERHEIQGIALEIFAEQHESECRIYWQREARAKSGDCVDFLALMSPGVRAKHNDYVPVLCECGRRRTIQLSEIEDRAAMKPGKDGFPCWLEDAHHPRWRWGVGRCVTDGMDAAIKIFEKEHVPTCPHAPRHSMWNGQPWDDYMPIRCDCGHYQVISGMAICAYRAANKFAGEDRTKHNVGLGKAQTMPLPDEIEVASGIELDFIASRAGLERKARIGRPRGPETDQELRDRVMRDIWPHLAAHARPDASGPKIEISIAGETLDPEKNRASDFSVGPSFAELRDRELAAANAYADELDEITHYSGEGDPGKVDGLLITECPPPIPVAGIPAERMNDEEMTIDEAVEKCVPHLEEQQKEEIKRHLLSPIQKTLVKKGANIAVVVECGPCGRKHHAGHPECLANSTVAQAPEFKFQRGPTFYCQNDED